MFFVLDLFWDIKSPIGSRGVDSFLGPRTHFCRHPCKTPSPPKLNVLFVREVIQHGCPRSIGLFYGAQFIGDTNGTAWHKGTVSEAKGSFNSVLVLCVTHIWATPGYHRWGQGSASAHCLYFLLQAFERRQGTISEAEWLSPFNVWIVFYTHLATPGYHKWGLSQPDVCIMFYTHCLNSMLVFCFTRI